MSSLHVKKPGDSLTDFPHIKPSFLSSGKERDGRSVAHYQAWVEEGVRRAVPAYIFDGTRTKEEQFQLFRQALPLLTWTDLPKKAPGEVSFFLICRLRSDAFRFFYDMVSRWLIPERRAPIPLLFAADFAFDEIDGEQYTLVEIIFRIETAEDLQTVKRNLWVLEAEIQMGADSHYKASRILEAKGLSGDEKTTLVREHIYSLMQRRKELQEDIFLELQRFLVVTSDDFKQHRDYRHMSRIVISLYVFQQSIKRALRLRPKERHIHVKLLRTLVDGASSRRVLGCLVLLNFLEENEVFEEEHLLGAIQSIIPQAKDVEGSFFAYQSRVGSTCALYMEVEPAAGGSFTPSQISALRDQIQGELHSRIEQLVHAVFMPRNEEEVLKNLLVLKRELSRPEDLPQVMISFEDQTASQLSFNVIILRVRKPGLQPVKDLFYQAETPLDFTLDREKVVGHIDRSLPKEATIFRLKIRKDPFLRKNRAVDIGRARQAVSAEVERVIGPFRDYNGGMMAKQEQLLKQAKRLAKLSPQDEAFMESFFYSITPDLMRGLFEKESLVSFFQQAKQVLGDVLQGKKESSCTFCLDEQLYFIVASANVAFRQDLKQFLAQEDEQILTMTVSLEQQGICLDGGVCPSDSVEALMAAFPKLKG